MNTKRNFLIAFLTYPLVCKTKFLYSCSLTAKQPKGPFYKFKNKKTPIDLTNNGKAYGDKVKISGKVMDNQCNPYGNSFIKIWQANSFGKYDHENDLSNNKMDNNFSGYTTIKTDKNGFYKFFTIVPGPYKITKNFFRPPHIHFSVVTQNKKILNTQLYFKNHPLNANDFLYKKIKNKKSVEIVLKKDANSKIQSGVFNFII